MTKKLLALALSLILTANLAACNTPDSAESSSAPSDSAPTSSDAGSSENPSSEDTTSSSRPSGGSHTIEGSQSGFKDNIVEEPEEKPDDDSDKDGGAASNTFEGQIVAVPVLTTAAGKTVTVSGENSFTYKTATWEGPKGYALVIPYGDTGARQAAELIRNYFYYATGVNLNISYDTVLSEVEKEILVGKTNRKDSNKNLKENEFNVRVVGKKLVFEAGHSATLETAINRFFGIGIGETVVPTFNCKNDFSSTTFLSGYTYVWGDEFEGNELDFTKWSLDQKMGGFADLEVSTSKKVIKVGDGRLTLSAIHKPEASKPYVVPCSTTTMRHMNFVYGYCEIRARVPFNTGVWPSFWTQSTDVVSSKYGVYRTKNYFVEVDVFEIFGNKNTVVPNLHKWYDKNYYHYGQLHGAGDSTHTTSGTDKNYYFKNYSNLNNEYHTYGWEWTPTTMSMYVDGVCYKTYDITKSFDKNSDMTGFHDPEFVMFNNHVFTPASSFKPNLITGNEKVLPANYDIDYFRLYQKNDGKSKIYLDRTITGPYTGR